MQSEYEKEDYTLSNPKERIRYLFIIHILIKIFRTHSFFNIRKIFMKIIMTNDMMAYKIVTVESGYNDIGYIDRPLNMALLQCQVLSTYNAPYENVYYNDFHEIGLVNIPARLPNGFSCIFSK